MDRLEDFDALFLRGSKSDGEPGMLSRGYYWMSVNMLNVGGVLSCRPGYRCIVRLPQGHLQGASLFRPKVGLEEMLVVIEGHVYAAVWPFTSWRLLTNLHFSPSAKQIYWSMTEQSARRLDDTLESAIEIIDPRATLFIQDGGFTAPGWYDGSNSGHLRDHPFQTPIGGVMRWVGDRLWVADGSNVFASDIADPFSFREIIYLGGVGSFSFQSEVTAMALTPSLEVRQLLVFTESNCSLLQANIRDRSAWPNTAGFQQEVFAIGCPSQRSIVEHVGGLTWMTQQGVVTLDTAVNTKHTARVPIRDSELHISKMELHEDISLVAGAAFQKFVLMSVPAHDLYNKHTWVLNNASYESLTDESGPSWSGYWMGTRPVEWVYGTMATTERIYHVSADEDGENRLWESFLEERLDNGCPIAWCFESRGYFGQTSEVQKRLGQDCKFCYADVKLAGIEEDLDLAVFYAGGLRGSYKPILQRRIKVARGCFRQGQEYSDQTDVFAYKPQVRKERTEDARGQSMDQETGSCPVEREKNEDTDDCFQLMVAGHGPATLCWLRVLATPEVDDFDGEGTACTNEEGERALRFDGAGAKTDTLAEADAALSGRAIRWFESNQTASVTSDDGVFSSVAVGHAESIVSQAAADRVAQVIATKQADRDVQGQQPAILSYGKGFDETV